MGELLEQLDGTSPTEEIELYSLGKYNKDKTRPVRVIFLSKNEALNVLIAKNNLPNGND